ncbi:hypothetical protein GWC77_09805 [Paraburkholderia sp. NMBU_R16]|nr:hypothetical protein [Paraburkholderia sp. NMBU_R16]NRO96229.1 hypothetical protein [Paraburkholderia sp. NMBU_R16]
MIVIKLLVGVCLLFAIVALLFYGGHLLSLLGKRGARPPRESPGKRTGGE